LRTPETLQNKQLHIGCAALASEQDLYMHAVAIRKATAEKNPWLPKAIFEADTKAKQIDYEYMRNWV